MALFSSLEEGRMAGKGGRKETTAEKQASQQDDHLRNCVTSNSTGSEERKATFLRMILAQRWGE